MKCKNCGAELPDNSKYCDICGEICEQWVAQEDRKNKKEESRRALGTAKKGCRLIAIVIAGVFALLLVISAITVTIERVEYKLDEKNHFYDRDLTGWKTVASPEVLEKIDIGMTYEEVRDIVGGEGKLTEEDLYPNSYYCTYSWPGEYYAGDYHGRLDVRFSSYSHDGDPKAITPTANHILEDGIVDGEEIHGTQEIHEAYDWEKLDTVLVKKKQFKKISEGMNYEQVCEIFGGPGKLARSSLSIFENETYTSKEYYWKAKCGDMYTYVYLDFDDGIIKYLSEWQEEHID